MPSENRWDQHWLEVAQVVSKLSKDKHTKVGCVIVSKDNRHCSIGYNGFAAGIDETDEKWERPTKYEYVIHSETNSLLNCPFDTVGCSCYITLQPCHRCISNLANAGIEKVVYLKDYPNLCHEDIWKDIVISCFSDKKVYRYDIDRNKRVYPNLQ